MKNSGLISDVDIPNKYFDNTDIDNAIAILLHVHTCTCRYNDQVFTLLAHILCMYHSDSLQHLFNILQPS